MSLQAQEQEPPEFWKGSGAEQRRNRACLPLIASTMMQSSEVAVEAAKRISDFNLSPWHVVTLCCLAVSLGRDCFFSEARPVQPGVGLCRPRFQDSGSPWLRGRGVSLERSNARTPVPVILRGLRAAGKGADEAIGGPEPS